MAELAGDQSPEISDTGALGLKFVKQDMLRARVLAMFGGCGRYNTWFSAPAVAISGERTA